jgi:replicative DNA helicase
MPRDYSLALIEQSILSILIQDHSYIKKVSSKYFLSTTAINIFVSIISILRDKNIDLNLNNLSIEVNEKESFPKEKLSILFDGNVRVEDFNYYYDSLKKERAKDNIREFAFNNLIKEGTSKEEIDIKKLLKIKKVIDENISIIEKDDEPLVYDMDTLMPKYEATIKERDSGNYFHDTGCPLLNSRLTEGFPPQMITTIFGSSGVGKSTYALYLVNCQINKKIPSIYFTLEMSWMNTIDRLIASRRRIPISEFHPKADEENQIPEHIYQVISEEKEKLRKNKRFWLVEKPGLSLSQIEDVIIDVKKDMGVPYLICTIDLITMIKDFNKSSHKANDYEDSMNYLHEIVKRHNIHIVGVVQSRRLPERSNVRDVEDVKRKFKPRIEEIKNSSAFEERSRIVLSTFRERYFVEKYLPEAPELDVLEDIMEVDILKQNMGSLSRLKYIFDGRCAFIRKYIEEN